MPLQPSHGVMQYNSTMCCRLLLVRLLLKTSRASPPGGMIALTSRVPSAVVVSAARTIASLASPASLAGLRFAATHTSRPVSSSGVMYCARPVAAARRTVRHDRKCINQPSRTQHAGYISQSSVMIAAIWPCQDVLCLLHNYYL